VLGGDTKAEWFRVLSARGIPVAPVNDVSDLPNDEQILARGMLVEMESPDYGTITLPGNPIKMPGALPEAEWTPPPLLGVDEPALWRDDARAGASAPEVEPFDANLVGRDGASDWVLLAWSCEACGRVAFGLAERCPTCGSSDGHPTTLRDVGVLETWSRISPKGESPYIVGYALLGAAENPDAAVRVFARIDEAHEDQLELRMPVRVAFTTSEDGGPSLMHHFFVPAPGLNGKGA